MVKPNEMKPSRATRLMQKKRETAAVRASLQKAIDGALQSVRQHRQTLRPVQDGGFDVELAKQQLSRLTGLHGEVQALVGGLGQTDGEVGLDGAVLEELQRKGAGVEQRLLEFSAGWSETDGEAAGRQELGKKEVRKQLQEIILQMQAILSDTQAELEESDGAEELLQAKQDEVATLRGALEREQVQILVCDLGQSRKAMLHSRLHKLTLLLYRLRQLTFEPRLQGKLETLQGVALLAHDSVDGLNVEASNVAELLDGSLYELEGHLRELQWNRPYLFFVPLPVGWLMNRYHEVARIKSVQVRVLWGLGVSVALSGGMFLILFLLLILISGYASSSKSGIRSSLEKEEKILISDVKTFLEAHKEEQKIEVQIASFQAQNAISVEQIKEKEEQLKKRESQAKEEGGGDPGDESIQPEEFVEEQEKTKEELEGLQRKQSEQVDSLQLLLERSKELEREQDRVIEGITTRSTEVEAKARLLSRKEEASKEVDIVSAGGSSDAGDQIRLEGDTTSSGARIGASTTFGSESKIDENKSGSATKQEPEDNSERDDENKLLQLLAEWTTNQGMINQSSRILMAAFAGSLGSIMSILIRLDELEKANTKTPFLTGALKPLIGSIFGIAVFAILSTRVIDILPSSFYLYDKSLVETSGTQVDPPPDPLGDLDSQELYKIFLVAFLAGFSERLASDSLKSVGASRSLG